MVVFGAPLALKITEAEAQASANDGIMKHMAKHMYAADAIIGA